MPGGPGLVPAAQGQTLTAYPRVRRRARPTPATMALPGGETVAERSVRWLQMRNRYNGNSLASYCSFPDVGFSA